jgi:hypothetical protein
MEDMTYRPPREPLVAPGAIDCHVHDMTATVSADVSLHVLQARLAEHGQWLPIDGDATQSVGSLVACDSTGPLRLGYGAWRDLLLGAQFTNGRGELITAGGRTVKNVAGYDLTKFIVGQRSVFGSFVSITTRTYRRPAGAVLARHAPDVGIVSRLIPTSLRPQWAILTREHLFCGYLGDEPTLAFYRGALGRSEPMEVVERTLEQDIEHRGSLWNVDGAVVFRASVPPARMGELAGTLGALRWAADAGFGIVVGAANDPSDLPPLRDACAALGGSTKTFRGAFGPAIELSTTPAERQIIERLKHAFDPDQKLVPLPWQTL